MARPTVWVIKEQVKSTPSGPTPVDYTPACAYGDLQFITEFDLPVHHGSTVADQWYLAVLDFVHKYNHETDYIVLTGSPLAIFLVGHVLAIVKKSPRVLVWRREQNQYLVYDPLEAMEQFIAGASVLMH